MSESTRIPPRRKSKVNGQFMFSAMILVIVLASLLAMYFYIEEKNSANNQSLEIVADKVQNIEDKLSITNEDSAQNMDTVTDQISLLDREVRKLWGHRKGYLDNFKENDKRINSLEDKFMNLEAIAQGLIDKVDSLDEKIQLAEDLQLKITLLTNEFNKLRNVAEENESALKAIDQYRKQNNTKITEILTKINALEKYIEEIESEINQLISDGENSE
tara:strand:+ start:5019 stop:5669 length:651 start_codon:yes stop_codon:yes gene_type:complete